MTKKATSILAYITFIGWLIAFLSGDKEGAKVHLNNGILLVFGQLIGGVVSQIPVVGSIGFQVISVFVTVLWIVGLVYAIQDKDQELPLIGQIKIIQ